MPIELAVVRLVVCKWKMFASFVCLYTHPSTHPLTKFKRFIYLVKLFNTTSPHCVFQAIKASDVPDNTIVSRIGRKQQCPLAFPLLANQSSWLILTGTNSQPRAIPAWSSEGDKAYGSPGLALAIRDAYCWWASKPLHRIKGIYIIKSIDSIVITDKW